MQAYSDPSRESDPTALRDWPKRMTEGYRTGLWLRAFHKLPPLFKAEMEWRFKNCPESWRNPQADALADAQGQDERGRRC